MSEVISFEPNIPQLIVLKFPEGLNVQGKFGPRVMYTLEDGRRLYVDEPVAQSIRMGGYQPGQPFTITKRQAGKNVRWDVDPISTKPEEMSGALARSIRDFRKTVQSAPAVEARGTGTYGPARQAVPVSAPAPPRKVPANVAFGEIVSFVRSELETRGEQWNDEARQAAVCTMFIEAGKQGWLAPWDRK